MALTRTSLSAACGASDLTLSITSTSSGFPAVGVYASPPQILQVDGEKMLIQVVPLAGICKVMQRGYDGTYAQAHDVLAPVATSATPGDFVGVAQGAVDTRPPYVDDIVTVGQNGVIAVPIRNTTFLLTKATALASTTLAAPGKDQDGLRLTFTNQTNAAHVITATSLFGDGVTGAPHSTATFGAFIGASLVVVADNGLWNLVSAVVCPIT